MQGGGGVETSTTLLSEAICIFGNDLDRVRVNGGGKGRKEGEMGREGGGVIDRRGERLR